jgi:hypothetical protein
MINYRVGKQFQCGLQRTLGFFTYWLLNNFSLIKYGNNYEQI